MGASKDVSRRLLEMKETLEQQKVKRAELQGEVNSLTSQLEAFGIGDLGAAKKWITDTEAELEKTEKALQTALDELEAKVFGS